MDLRDEISLSKDDPLRKSSSLPFSDQNKPRNVDSGAPKAMVTGRGSKVAGRGSKVRKRPLNKKELSRKEGDVVSVSNNGLTGYESKLRVDLTAYVERHEFCFDAVLDQQVTNDEEVRNQKFKLWLSYFEITGGKLYDLLSDRKKLCMREDGRQQVCIVGLQEFEVLNEQVVKEYIEGEMLVEHNEVKDTRRNNKNNNDTNESKGGKVVGKISFIDLAGSERGADTTDNDRQTR
ncbi:kinesin-like protein KIN-13A [Tanacetum coccineum]